MKSLTLLLLLAFTMPAQAQVFTTEGDKTPEYLAQFEVRFGSFYTYSDSLGLVTDSTLTGTVHFTVRDSLGAAVEVARFNLVQIQGQIPAQVRTALLDLKVWFGDKIREERSVK